MNDICMYKCSRWSIQPTVDARSEKGKEEYAKIVKVMLNMDWLRLYESHGIFNLILALIIDFISWLNLQPVTLLRDSHLHKQK